MKTWASAANLPHAILYATPWTLAGCTVVTCDGDDVEAVMARTLSPERLMRLHQDALPFATGEHRYGPIPEVFSDLDVIAIRSHFDGMVQLRLRGCMDHHLDLVVYATNSGRHPGKARVELWYDESPRIEEVLMTMPEPVAIGLTTNNGSLPPPHRRSMELQVRSDGTATLERMRGYNREPSAIETEEFQVDADAHQQLSRRIAELALYSRNIAVSERHPVGGGTAQLTLTSAAGSVRFPSFPADPADVQLRDELVAAVKALIPPKEH